MAAPTMPGVNPFGIFDDGYKSWHGRLVSVDGTATGSFTEADLDKLIFAGESNPGDWDGECAAVMLLKDGRYVAWETNWGPTGNGFSEDAYGGDADVYFASTLDAAINLGLTQEGRALAGVKLSPVSKKKMRAAARRLRAVERSLKDMS